jgi:hypothetical protein
MGYEQTDRRGRENLEIEAGACTENRMVYAREEGADRSDPW